MRDITADIASGIKYGSFDTGFNKLPLALASGYR
jgi:hypothetical protein